MYQGKVGLNTNACHNLKSSFFLINKLKTSYYFPIVGLSHGSSIQYGNIYHNTSRIITWH